jgi:hypothetical protein
MRYLHVERRRHIVTLTQSLQSLELVDRLIELAVDRRQTIAGLGRVARRLWSRRADNKGPLAMVKKAKKFFPLSFPITGKNTAKLDFLC